MESPIEKEYLNIGKGSVNSVLNLNTTWTAVNFLNYIYHIFSGTIVDWYGSLDKDNKNVLRMIESPPPMFKKLCKEIKTKFIRTKFDSKGSTRE